MTLLKISDLIKDNLKDEIELQQTLQKVQLLNRNTDYEITLARYQIFFEEIAKDASLFESGLENIRFKGLIAFYLGHFRFRK